MNEIKEPDAGNLNREADRLEERSGREARVKLRPRISDAGSKWTSRTDAARTRYLRHHGVTRQVLDDDVIVNVIFLLVQGHRCINNPDGSLRRSDSGVKRRTWGIRRSSEGAEKRDRSRNRGKVHLRRVRICARLDRPSFHAAGRALHGEGDWRSGTTRLSIGYGSEDALCARRREGRNRRKEREYVVAW